MNIIFIIAITTLCVEAVTEILVASKIFFNLRDRLSQRGELVATFVNCGYCMSVWVSAAVVWALPRLLLDHPADFVFRVFVVHRLSNVLHELFSRWFGRMPWMLVLNQPSPEVPQVLKREANGAEEPTPDAPAEEGSSQ